MKKLVLFDIDGTLLWTDGAGREAIHRALVKEMGTAGPIDGFRFDGKTDPQIVHELLAAAGHPSANDPGHVQAVCDRYATLLHGELNKPERNVRVLPGVKSLLDALEERGDIVLGLLTGNLAAGAELKLQRAGIDPARFVVGAFGSDAAEREALPAIAVERAAKIIGRPPKGHDVVILGDTPADVTCGNSIGARAIGVATGFFTAEDLRAAGAFAVFDDFANTEQVIASIVT
jgi:phosphoglycolate phosphatase-like HAD superfamily hydrolase